MPYDLVQASPKRFFVVNTETGRKHSEKPLGMKKAKAQLRILMKIKGGDEDPKAQYKEYLQSYNQLADIRASQDTAEEVQAKKDAPILEKKYLADQSRFFQNVPQNLLKGEQTYYRQFRGGAFMDLANTTAEIPALSG